MTFCKTQANSTAKKKKLAAYNLGKSAEALAVQFLTQHGYTDFRQRYKNPYGEIDIIAINYAQNRLAFVEVKARRLTANPDSDPSAKTQAIHNSSAPVNASAQPKYGLYGSANYDKILGLISAKQQQRYIEAAQYFLMENEQYSAFFIGFDVIIFDKMRIVRYIRNAWTA